MAIKYKVLSARERLVTLEAFLRDREAEHYRLSQLPGTDTTREARIPVLEEELTGMQKEYETLKREVAKEAT